jgi:hypothetical protein
MNATTFMNNEDSFAAVADALESVGCQREGEEILYSGITGHQLVSSVFMGPLYYMRLKHLTQDKINARSAGRKEMLTHQPTGGRGNEGGMRVGEMERDSLIAHGVTSFLHETMMKRSDGAEVWICNGCGTVPIVNEDIGLYLCPVCDGPIKDNYTGKTADTLTLTLPVRQSRTTFSKVEMPYSMKLLDQEIARGQYQMRYLTANDARGFREARLPARDPPPPAAANAANTAAANAANTTAAAAAAAATKPKNKSPRARVVKPSPTMMAALSAGGTLSSVGNSVAQQTQDLSLLSREGVKAAEPAVTAAGNTGNTGTVVNITIPGLPAPPFVPTAAPDLLQSANAGAAEPAKAAATAPAPAPAPATAPPASGGILGGLSSALSAVAGAPAALASALQAPVPSGLASAPSGLPSAPSGLASESTGPTLSIRPEQQQIQSQQQQQQQQQQIQSQQQQQQQQQSQEDTVKVVHIG